VRYDKWAEEKPGRGGRVTTRLCFMKKIILLAFLGVTYLI